MLEFVEVADVQIMAESSSTSGTNNTSARDRILELETRMRRIEGLLGVPTGSPTETLYQQVEGLHAVADRNVACIADLSEFVERRMVSVGEDFESKYEGFELELNLLKKAVGAGTTGHSSASTKFKVPDPKPFGGKRSAKELENFLWDMETYFQAAKVPDEEKVSITSMYLIEDAKLWWRARLSDDASANRDKIETWETLKRELKEQFLPSNTSWLARESLRKLKHSGTTRDYVKDFSSLMLDVRDMSEEDKLFNFLAGLQPWAQAELRRQGVKDLPSAIAAADRLVDFKAIGASDAVPKRYDAKDKGKSKFVKSDKFRKKKNKKDGESITKEIKETYVFDKTKRGCFICNGDHRMRDCPKKEKLSALVAEEEKIQNEDGPSLVNPLQLLGALHVEKQSQSKGLMYVKTLINGREIMAMVDTGATHNFVAEREVQSLGLKLAQHSSQIKAVNSEAKPIKGVTNVELKVGSWSGQCGLMAVPLDDFDVILGNEFLVAAQVAVMPHLGGLLIADVNNPSFVKGVYDVTTISGKKAGLISAIQIEKGLRHGDVTYVAAMVEIKPDVYQEVPDAVADLLEQFHDIMPVELPKSLPPRRAIDHKIELEPGAVVPAKAPYRMSPSELVELRKQLTELLDCGMIQPSKAPFGSPVLFQKKQDGTLRMCIDYRALNKVTIKNKYPIPNVLDLFDKLSRARYFTKIDLRSGYWQVRIAEGDEAKTTCVTRYGSYEFLVMPFGLTNAPATFCNLMNDVLFEYLDRFVVVYLDDIVVYSESLEDHLMHLTDVFSRLREYELYVKKEKCEFCRDQITFLGHVIGRGKVHMDKKKVQAIVDWSAPTKESELRSFLGLTNYYRRFIMGYSRIVGPLTDLLRKGNKYAWSVQCVEAFETLKKAIVSEPVLRLPEFDKPFEVFTDASDRALGGVLMQERHPIAFESRKLKDAEVRYSTHEKEMMAVVHCLEVWRHYLLGTKFVVITDNVANTYFQTQKKLTPKQARWQEFLSEFDFQLVHKAGKHNEVADALSRKSVHDYVAALTVIESDFLGRIREASPLDKVYQKLVDQVRNGEIRKYWIEDELLFAKGNRAYVPSGPLRKELLRETHDPQWAGHPGVARMLALLCRTYYWPKMEEDVEHYVKTCLVCQLDKTERLKEAGLLQPLPIPERPWQSVSMDFILGFPKVNGLASILVVVDRFTKYAVFIGAPKVCSAELTAELFFKNVIKYFGVPQDIVSDRDTRFTGRFWTALFNMMGSELKFSTANHPQTDGQTERMNQLLEEYMRHYVTASQRNWADLLDVAQFSYNLHKSSATGLSPFELLYSFQPTTPHEVALQKSGGDCPAAYRFARAKQELLDEAKDSLAKAQRRMKKYADKGRRDVEFQVGERVLLKLTPQIWKKISAKTVHRGLVPRYDGPFEVMTKVGKVAYRLKLPDRLKIHPTFHVSFLKKFQEDQTRVQTSRAPPVVRYEFDRKVARILDDRVLGQSKKNRRVDYLVQWVGDSEADATWIRNVNLWQFEDEIADYEKRKGLLGVSTWTSSSSSGGGLLDP